ncbi:hypothetical protein NE237_020458 [Protea cynaroides]|uniref:Uncharacterized protein n=1 Tax=Protea cynaroides TaxID=273540 RepID=A0A9Q0H950_9MAGN|nr:hypothetical protein NE237_020458 [Protea cynaroides]
MFASLNPSETQVELSGFSWHCSSVRITIIDAVYMQRRNQNLLSCHHHHTTIAKISNFDALVANREAGNRPVGLTHHFSLPKTSAKIAAMEICLQFHNFVPCKI